MYYHQVNVSKRPYSLQLVLALFYASRQHIKSECISLSAFPFNLRSKYVCGRFLLHFYIFWSRFPRLLQQPQSVFLREHIFMGFNDFPSFVCWCTVIHHHRPTLFQRGRGCVYNLLVCVCLKASFYEQNYSKIGALINLSCEGCLLQTIRS